MIGADDTLCVLPDIGMASTFEAANINAAAAEHDKISLCTWFLPFRFENTERERRTGGPRLIR